MAKYRDDDEEFRATGRGKAQHQDLEDMLQIVTTLVDRLAQKARTLFSTDDCDDEHYSRREEDAAQARRRAGTERENRRASKHKNSRKKGTGMGVDKDAEYSAGGRSKGDWDSYGQSGYAERNRQRFEGEQPEDYKRQTDFRKSSSYGENGNDYHGIAVNYSGRGPKGYKRSDERIKEEICDAMDAHPRLDASEIEVTVAEGAVKLSGFVSSRQVKHLAEDLVDNCRGVKDIDNQIKVRRVLR